MSSKKSPRKKTSSSKSSKRSMSKAEESKKHENLKNILEEYGQKFVTIMTYPIWTVEEKKVLDEAFNLILQNIRKIRKGMDPIIIDPLEEKQVLMITPDYERIFIPLRDVEKYKEEKWKVAGEEFTYTDPLEVTKKIMVEAEERVRNLFNFLEKERLVHPAPYEKYNWNDFWNEFIRGEHEYTIHDFAEAEGVMFGYMYWHTKHKKWEPYITSYEWKLDPYLIKKEGEKTIEDIIKKGYYSEYQVKDYIQEKAELQKEDKDKYPESHPASALYYDFKTNKVYEVKLDYNDKVVMNEFKRR